jgi:hypothetical protein
MLGYLGVVFDWWQVAIAKLVLAKRADGLYATSEGIACVSIPRQTGKTTMFGYLVVALALLTPGMTVVWTAHHLRTSNQTFRKMRVMCGLPAIKPLVTTIRLANGEGEIGFANGSRILFGARGMGFGLGFDKVDALIMDEAQRVTQVALDDLIPTTSAAVNPLVIMMGTPPRPKDSGEAFTNHRVDAISGKDTDSLWVEFAADSDCQFEKWTDQTIDWAQVGKANPSFPHRVGKPSVKRLRKNLGNESFGREGLGIWDLDVAKDEAIPVAWWQAQLIEPPLEEDQRIVSDFTVCLVGTRDRRWVFVARAGERADGVTQAELVAKLPTDGVADFLTAHRARIREVVAQSRGGGVSSEVFARLAGDPKFKLPLVAWQGADLTGAYGRGMDALAGGMVATLDHPELSFCVPLVVWKPLGGGQIIDGTKSGGEMAPLSAWFGAVGMRTRVPEARKTNRVRVAPMLITK